MATRLSLVTLKSLRKDIVTPAYERDELSPGIAHFGVGNFHRSHQAVYLDRLFSLGRDLDWAIVGTGVMDSDETIREKLKSQDYLSTVIEQSAITSKARVTGVMIDFLAPSDIPSILAYLSNPDVRIVSLTITEGGYFIDAATGGFDANNPAILADSRSPSSPKTVFGLIVAALKLRWAQGSAPFTVMSCDNIPHNGNAARSAVVGTARLSDPELAEKIEKTVAFPNSMVDRITPATTELECQRVIDEFAIQDAWPVYCEEFSQWILEDKFPSGRPALDQVGVQFVDDVSKYEAAKIRMLNGGHASIAYCASLLDIKFVHDAMEHKLISGFLEKLELGEIMPVVDEPAEMDLNQYLQQILCRFANPNIADTVRRLCYDGFNRQPKFIVPSIRDGLASRVDTSGLALVSALWCRYCFGVTDTGARIEPNDPHWKQLQEVAVRAREKPEAWLAMEAVYADLGQSEIFLNQFSLALTRLWEKGTESVLSSYLSGR